MLQGISKEADICSIGLGVTSFSGTGMDFILITKT